MRLPLFLFAVLLELGSYAALIVGVRRRRRRAVILANLNRPFGSVVPTAASAWNRAL